MLRFPAQLCTSPSVSDEQQAKARMPMYHQLDDGLGRHHLEQRREGGGEHHLGQHPPTPEATKPAW
eukprot:SAG31_NODE_39439_length_288_cov_0.814815_1_plen_65_part_10